MFALLVSEDIGPLAVYDALITLACVQYQNVGVMLFGTVIGGTGFETVFSGTLRSVLPYAERSERAGLCPPDSVEGYLSFSLPALAAGFLAPIIGLTSHRGHDLWANRDDGDRLFLA